MSDIVLRTQERNAGRFLNTPQKADLLDAQPHNSVSHPISMEKLYTTAIGSDGFDQWIEYELPFGYIGECWVVATLGTLSSGNWTTYPGISLVERVELRSGSNILQQFDYAPVMHDCMSRMDSKTIANLQAVTGGTGLASGNVVIPLPLFWTKTSHPHEEYMPPLNTHLASTKLRLRLKIRSAADSADAGATVGSPTISTRLYFVQLHTSEELRGLHIQNKDTYSYKSHDFQTFPKTSVANATSTTIDISGLHGSIAELSVFNKLVSDVDTANDYFLDQGDIDEIKVTIDGKDYWISEIEESNEWARTLLGPYKGTTATFGDPVLVPFSVGSEPQNFTGGLEMDTVNKLNLVLKHSAGANAYVDGVARTNAFYVLRGGSFVRVN